MTGPIGNPRAERRGAAAAMSAAFSRAVDLSGLADRARRQAPTSQPPADLPTADRVDEAADTGADAGGRTSRFVIDVTEETFNSVIEASMQVLVVIDLWATWCQPCKQLSPVLENLAAAAGGSWILAKVDVDANPRISQAFGVQSVPTVVAIAGGQPVDAFSGALPEPQVRQWISGLLDALRDKLPGIAAAEQANGGPAPEPEDSRFAAAEDLLAAEDYAAAAAAYQQIVDAEPGNARAKAALAQATFFGRVADHPEHGVSIADANLDDVAAQCVAADIELAGGDPPGAFTRLIDTIRRTADDDRTAAREHLVALFALFDVDDPQVVAARRQLAAALY